MNSQKESLYESTLKKTLLARHYWTKTTMINFPSPPVFIFQLVQGHVVVRLVTKTRLSGGDHGYPAFARKQSVIALIISVAVQNSATFPEAQNHEIVVYH